MEAINLNSDLTQATKSS